MVTGGEIAAGAAVVKAAAGAAKEDRSTKDQLTELAKNSPALQAAAESRAKRMALKQHFLLNLYKPLGRWFGVADSYFDNEFATDMAPKIVDIPDESLVTPKVSIAVPAIQGLAYSLDEPDLKEMYLNLLATASDARRTDEAHPSFAEIIKQLSADEAALLNPCLQFGELAIIRLRRKKVNETGFRILRNHILDLHDTVTRDIKVDDRVPSYIDNWSRLGLMTARYDEWFDDVTRYAWADARPELLELREEAAKRDGVSIEWDKGLLQITDFGARFAKAVAII